jgi:hypothetical protein
MTVGDKGVPIVYTPPAGLVDMTGATVTLLVALAPPSAALSSFAMAVAGNYLSATYTSTGTEWPNATNDETYDCWVTVVQPGGDTFTSDPGTITVKAKPRSNR